MKKKHTLAADIFFLGGANHHSAKNKNTMEQILRKVFTPLLIDEHDWVAIMGELNAHMGQEGEPTARICYLAKHKGKTLGEIALVDPKYLEYLVKEPFVAETFPDLRDDAAVLYVEHMNNRGPSKADRLLSQIPHFAMRKRSAEEVVGETPKKAKHE